MKLSENTSNPFHYLIHRCLFLTNHSLMLLLFLILLPVTGGLLHPKINREKTVAESGYYKTMPGPNNHRSRSSSYRFFSTFWLSEEDTGLQRQHDHGSNGTPTYGGRPITFTKASGNFVNKKDAEKYDDNQSKNIIEKTTPEKAFLGKTITDAKRSKEIMMPQRTMVTPPRRKTPHHFGDRRRRQLLKREHMFNTNMEFLGDPMLRTVGTNSKEKKNRTRRRRGRRQATKTYVKKHDKMKLSETSQNTGKRENINMKNSDQTNDDGARTSSSPEIAAFEEFITQVMSCRQIPALSIALVKKGVPLLVRAFGVADVEKSRNASAKTKFFIASLTKSFTSTIIARVLSERRDLKWNTAIHQFIPDFQLQDETRTELSTLRDLLGHRTGVCGYFRPLLYGYPERMSRKEFVKLIRYQPICSGFRDRFHYNNYMYVYAAHIIEKLTEKTWEELVMCHLLKPIGMKDTGFADNMKPSEDFAFPYVRKDGKLKRVGMEVVKSVTPAGPAGSMYSTAGDMLKWMQLHLNLHANFNSPDHLYSAEKLNTKLNSSSTADQHERFNKSLKSNFKSHSIPRSRSDFECDTNWNSDDILNAAQLGIDPNILLTTHEAVSPKPYLEPDITRPHFPIDDAFVSYNMGWITSMYRGFKRLWHSGSIPPYGSVLHMYPEVNSGLFISVNGPFGIDVRHALSTIAWKGSDLLLGLEPWLNRTTACTYPQPWRPVNGYGDENVRKNMSAISDENNASRNTFPNSQDSKIQGVSSSKAQNVSMDQLFALTGDYIHPGFGLIKVTFNSSCKMLQLRIGRYGHLLLVPSQTPDSTQPHEYYNGTVSNFEAINIGPYWFLSSSDDGHERLSVNFYTHVEITKLWFPVGAGDPVAFIRKSHRQSRASAFWNSDTAFKYLVLHLLLLYFF